MMKFTLLLLLIIGCYCKPYTVQMFDSEDCPGTPNAYLAVNMGSIMSEAFSNVQGMSYNDTTSCFTVQQQSVTVSSKWECTNDGGLKYGLYSTPNCTGSGTSEVDLSALYKDACINACGVSTKFKCGNQVIGDEYVHISVYSPTADTCTDKPDDIALDIFYKLKQCNSLAIGQFMFSFMIGSPNGDDLWYAFYQGGDCKTILAVNKWTSNVGNGACLEVGLRRSTIPSLVMQYRGYGEDDASETTSTGAPTNSENWPPIDIDDLFGGGLGMKVMVGIVMLVFGIVLF